MNENTSSGGTALRDSWPVWAGLAIGVEGFALGALSNPSALVPMWGRNDWTSVGIVALLAVLAAALQRRVRRPVPYVAAVGSALVVTTFGMSAFAAVSLILVACYALGARILEWAEGVPSPSAASEPCFAATVGLAACALLFGFTSHLRVNLPVAAVVLAIVAIWMGRRHVIALWKGLVAASSGERHFDLSLLTCAALWLAFGLHISFAALPERYADALAMHLVVLRGLENFGLWHFDAREYTWAVAPMGANWLLGWVYLLAGEYAAKLLNVVFLLLMGGLMLEAGLVSRRLGLFAVAILALTPLTFIETASLFVDNALALLVTAAIVFAARIRDLPNSASVAGFALASAGAMAVKPQGLIAFGAACIALLIVGGWREIAGAGNRTRIACALAAVAAAWPYAYAWHATGNPVFPYFNGYFKSPLFAPENFENELYPGGLLPADLYELTFFATEHIEGYDGAIGFALTLLLPAGILLAAVRGSPKMRVIALSTLLYTLSILINTRYLRYLFPALPLFALVMVYPLSATGLLRLRNVYLVISVAAIVFGILRIPAAGWILNRFDPTMAFSARAKERLADVQVPLRRLGRIQAALGNNDSHVVIFGQSVGADIKGRPAYVTWYFPKLEALIRGKATPEDAAIALATLNASYVIFDRRDPKPQWAPWEAAVRRYGRLIAATDAGELYEFQAGAVPGKNVFPDSDAPWHGWALDPAQEQPISGDSLILPPAVTASRAADLSGIPEDAQITLSVEHVCAAPSTIRVQINWLRQDGSIIRADGTQSRCAEDATRGSLRVAPPKEARTAYFYFTNDGQASARLFGERASALSRP